MLSEWLSGLGFIALTIVIIILICIPIIIGIVIAMAIANYFALSGLLWWCVVIFIALVIWGILGRL